MPCVRNLAFVIVAALAFISFTAPALRADTIDFDDLPAGSNQSLTRDRYQAQGVLLGTNGVGIFAEGPVAYTNTPFNYIYASTSSINRLANAQVIIDFVVPGTTTPGLTNFVSFYVSDAPGFPDAQFWSASIFDTGGSLLASRLGTASQSQVVFSRVTSDISRLVFIPSIDFEGIDTLSFGEVQAVPEPTTMLLLGTGLLAGIAVHTRRRR